MEQRMKPANLSAKESAELAARLAAHDGRWPAPRGTPGGLPELKKGRAPTLVYFIRLGDDGPVKIGCAVNPQRRLGELQIGCPIPLRLLAVRRGGRLRERQLHARFMAYRVKGEWYAWNAGLRDLLRDRRR